MNKIELKSTKFNIKFKWKIEILLKFYRARGSSCQLRV